MGASAGGAIAHLLRGSLVETMAKNLPQETRLLIYFWMPSKRESVASRAGTVDNRVPTWLPAALPLEGGWVAEEISFQV